MRSDQQWTSYTDKERSRLRSPQQANPIPAGNREAYYPIHTGRVGIRWVLSAHCCMRLADISISQSLRETLLASSNGSVAHTFDSESSGVGFTSSASVILGLWIVPPAGQ